MPMLARSAANVMLTGMPLWIVVTPAICQPPSTYFRSAFDEFLKNGSS